MELARRSVQTNWRSYIRLFRDPSLGPSYRVCCGASHCLEAAEGLQWLAVRAGGHVWPVACGPRVIGPSGKPCRRDPSSPA